ncbi:MAG TPA: DUF255 domain-containing protein [Candidatus Thiothrix moscowensis]|uniref:thioredoxin domain-containing protein n=1 Tax=unclassified Thiothrix TaxID=2636184 RepID=UPI0025DF61F9|nr:MULTISPECIES: DUF255 domain-containing protein [unclassified Thiothrix]HRJ52072.1 DUF255 domain-containing protein [Candidatus Thiothrix moscowensis]HRJ92417.1 DUF255 domain-containing protein [Candidatus Thiothrix moscowensis]
MRLLTLLCLCLLPLLSHAVHNSVLRDHPSPYFRTHSDDSIHWNTFSATAFEQAKTSGKPILISSGYSSCYWCHKMKQDTFSDKAVGETVNAGFIPIIVDRELEPEVDAYLQTFMEQQRGFGGWPLTVMLTPDALPIGGFNYTKADEFNATLQRFLNDWATNKTSIQEKAQAKANTLAQQRDAAITVADTTTPLAVLQAFLQHVSGAGDEKYGGFGDQEKFPNLPQLSALFTLHQLKPDKDLYAFLQTSLAALIGGGLRDHLGGGFFRYTDDRRWTHPHYEQMLYTQVLAAPLLIRAGVEFKQPVYLQAGREALLHTLTAFRRDDGLLRAGLSAVGGDGTAGGYYLWKPEQLSATVGKDWQNSVHNLLGEEADKVLPFVTLQGAAGKALREKLLSERRTRPLTSDDKALLGWNGLALNAFAAAQGLDPELQQAGEKLAAQLLALTKQDTLPRLIGEPAAGEAQFADRVYLAYGLAAWGKANEQSAFTEAARQLLHDTYQRYYQGKGWVQSEANPLLGEIAVPVIADSQLPSPSALWLVTVWQVADQDPVLRKIAEEISAILPNALRDNAFFHATHIAALVQHATKEKP